MLFYLGSRGISEEKAVDLMAGARIGRIIREVGDEIAEQNAKAFLGIEEE
jgi:Fe-S cluster assembly scaffold protein SufB